MKNKSKWMRKSAAVLGICFVLNSHAETPSAAPTANAAQSDDNLQDIIVTAQRRSENLQDVPIAVTVLSAAQLQSAGIVNTAGLASVTPSLTFADANGFLEPRIRGIGNSAAGPGVENSVATYVDGVYIASAPATLLSLGGVNRVEVLDGPQGTLFGRNAVGGLIQIVTKDPEDHFSGNADVSYGDYQTSRANIYATGPLTQKAAADVALSIGHQGQGYGRNIDTGDSVYRTDVDASVRSKVIVRPDDLTTLKVAVDYSQTSTSDPAFSVANGTKPADYPTIETSSNPWDTDTDVNPIHRIKAGGVSLRIDRSLGPITLTDIAAYRQMHFFTEFDGDLTPTPAVIENYNQDDRQISEEFQIAPTESGNLHWIIGAYYLHLDSKYDPLELTIAALDGGHSHSISNQDSITKSIAGFAQATYEIVPATNLTLGIRYTQDDRSLAGNVAAVSPADVIKTTANDGTKSYGVPTWRAVLDHDFTGQLMSYLSYNRGYKSGGFNAQSPTAPAYNPEILDAYEIGMKSLWLDRKLRFNAAAYFYNYKDIQVNTFLGTLGVIYNGASARTYGLDVDFDYAITRQLKLTGGLDLLHDRFTSFPLAVIATELPNGSATLAPGSATGNRLPFAPDATARLGFDYTIPASIGNFDAVIEDLYNSGFYTQPDNVLHQEGFHMLNGSVTWSAPSGDYWLRLWANNIANSAVRESDVVSTVAQIVSFEPPRTFGATLGVKF